MHVLYSTLREKGEEHSLLKNSNGMHFFKWEWHIPWRSKIDQHDPLISIKIPRPLIAKKGRIKSLQIISINAVLQNSLC